MKTLNAQIESRLVEAGASLIGFADISGLPVTARGEMKFAVSIAVALDVSIINEISEGSTRRYYHVIQMIFWYKAFFPGFPK